MWVSTFHSTCVRILRNQASLLPGLNSNFSIYDADDSRRLLMMIAKDMGLDVKRYSPRLLANGISNLKNELIDPAHGRGRGVRGRRRAAAHRRRGLRRVPARLRAANALDFDDLIGETVGVLQAFPQIAQYYRRRFRHILVDEYQDTNHAQYMLVRELVGTRIRRGPGAVSARRTVRRRRRRPVDLRVPRRHHPQHRGLRARLPERHHDSAGAELPLHAEHPVGRQLRHLPQRRAAREAAVDRRRRAAS